MLNSDDEFLEKLYFDHKIKLDALSQIHTDDDRTNNQSPSLTYKNLQMQENNDLEVQYNNHQNIEDNEENTDQADLLKLVNSGMIKHFGYEEEEEESVHMSDDHCNSEDSRHIDQSMREEDK